jgi:hypothetical protein
VRAYPATFFACARRFAVAIFANDFRNSCNLIAVLRVPSVSRIQPIIHPPIGLIGFPERGNDGGGVKKTWSVSLLPFLCHFSGCLIKCPKRDRFTFRFVTLFWDEKEGFNRKAINLSHLSNMRCRCPTAMCIAVRRASISATHQSKACCG